MPYPREILLDEATEAELTRYLDQELANHYGERGRHMDDLMRWQKDYWAEPVQKKATFPFSGAATIVIPLSAIAIEAIHARTMTTAFALEDLVSARPVNPQWSDASRPFERFMNHYMRDVMRIRRPMNDCFLECTKFGTMIGKVGYERIVKTAVRPMGDSEEEFDVVVADGATFDPVPDSRFLMPYSSKDPQMAPWCGEEHTATWYEATLMEQSGLFRPGTVIDPKAQVAEDGGLRQGFSRLRAFYNNTLTGGVGDEGGKKFDENQARLEHTSESPFPTSIDWVEIWLAFDVDGSKRLKEIVVHYHRPSRTLLSVRYNWHSDLRRPYRIGVYFPIEHRWRGIGVCKKNEQFQKIVTTQHRQRLDNGTLANMRMIKIHKLSGYGPREPVFPGKMWFLDDMSHIETFQMGEVYPSGYQNESSSVIYSQQRTGVNETNLGMPQIGTPGTATSDLARIQEGNKKWDFIYGNFHDFLSDIVTDTAVTIQESGPRSLPYYTSAENGELVQMLFDMPAFAIRDGLLIKLRPAGQKQNKILDRQNWQQLAGMLNQYFTGILQLSQFAGDPQLTNTIVYKAMGAATEAMRQILETFDVRNVDRIVVKEIEDMLYGLQNAQPGQVGPGQSPSPNGAPGMDLVSQIMSSIGGNGNGATNQLQLR